MILPDDTLEYWGFYLMKGATVELKVCSRYDGSRILVVKGQRNLRTCGLMDHNKNKFGANFNAEQSQVKVTFETAAEIVNSADITLKEQNLKLAQDKPVEDEALLNHGGEEIDFDDDTRKKHKDFATNYLKVDKNALPGDKEESTGFTDDSDSINNQTEATPSNHHMRHKVHDKQHESPDNETEGKVQNARRRRSHNKIHAHREKGRNKKSRRDTTILDGGINHGGNAKNFITNNGESDSISSFENALLECYDGNILVAKSYDPSKNCNSVKSLEQGSHLVSTHEVNSDGYYYYIFYSDNDYDSNHIHAVFDIYKPSYLYSNISESKGCINTTECHFPIQMWVLL